MRSFTFTFITTALLAVGSMAHLNRLPREKILTVNPTAKDMRGLKRNIPTPVKREEDELTNGERFARGLPPLAPKKIHDAKRNGGASPCPSITKSGVIKADGAAGPLGYVSRIPNSFGEYGITPDLGTALPISFEYSSCASDLATIDLVATDGPYVESFKFVGAIEGFANTNPNLGPGSFHYAYLGGTDRTPPNSPPQTVGNSFTTSTGFSKTSESAVWTYTPGTNALTLQWINTDGSKPTTYAGYYPSDNFILFTGDRGAFINVFGSGSALALTFVSF